MGFESDQNQTIAERDFLPVSEAFSSEAAETERRRGAVLDGAAKLVHGTVWTGLATAMTRALPGVMTLILAWILRPDELGAVAFIIAYYTVLSMFADWGIAYALQKYIPENEEQAGLVAWTALGTRLFCSVIVAAICFAVDSRFHIFRGYGSLVELLIVASGFIIITFIQYARYRYKQGSLISIGASVTWVVLGFCLVLFGFRVSGPILALAVSFVIFGIVGFLLDGSVRCQFGFDFGIAWKLVHFGVWATLASTLTALSTQVGILTLTYMLGGTEAAIFKVATTIAMVPALVGSIVMQPLLPIATQSMKNGSQESGALIRLVIRYLLLLGFPIVSLTIALAGTILSAFFAGPYLAGVGTVRLLLAGNLLVMLSTALSAVLFMGNGIKHLTRINAIAAFITVVGTLALVKTSGSVGAAIAQFISSFVVLVMTIAWLRKKVQLPLELKRYFIFALSAIQAGVLAWVAAEMAPTARTKVAIGYAVGCVAYAVLVWVQRGIKIKELVTLNGIRRTGWESSAP